MSGRFRRLAVFIAAAALAPAAAPGARQGPAARVNIQVDYHTLANGLKVVLSRDTSSPTVVVGVYYNIGFRVEPKDRTGFAHLFEHMMFQGSEHLGKNAFIGLVESNGGLAQRLDPVRLHQLLRDHPGHTLETILWAEADRMRGLAITAGQPQEPAGRRRERGQGQHPQPAVRRVSLARSAAAGEHELVQRAQLLRRPRASRGGHPRRREAVLQDLLRAEQRRPRGERRLRPGADAGLGPAVLRRHRLHAAAAAA